MAAPPLNILMVGADRFELSTSSVSGKRSPPELRAFIVVVKKKFRFSNVFFTNHYAAIPYFATLL